MYYCDFDGRGCVAKEMKEIESVTESRTEFEITVLKLQIILMSLSFKTEKRSKNSEKNTNKKQNKTEKMI